VSDEYEESKASPYTRSPKAGVSDVTWASAVVPVYFKVNYALQGASDILFYVTGLAVKPCHIYT
jgi:hypothetical protein